MLLLTGYVLLRRQTNTPFSKATAQWLHVAAGSLRRLANLTEENPTTTLAPPPSTLPIFAQIWDVGVPIHVRGSYAMLGQRRLGRLEGSKFPILIKTGKDKDQSRCQHTLYRRERMKRGPILRLRNVCMRLSMSLSLISSNVILTFPFPFPFLFSPCLSHLFSLFLPSFAAPSSFFFLLSSSSSLPASLSGRPIMMR